jgi:hypothetical protein
MRALLLAVFALCIAQTASAAPDVVLKGAIAGKDNGTYRDIPFAVPAGVTRITVSFTHTGQQQKTVIDLGLFDSERFRGWSGGDKTTFTLSATDATPSYLPGPIHAGTWHLILGIPNIRKDATATYEADITFTRKGAQLPASAFSDAPLRTGPAWYRGDLHMHTAQSDGSCDSLSGKHVPCPLFKTLEAAAARHLDFIAVTDHNTTSHFNDARELQPYFDTLLLIPGREITTYRGHANVFGPTDFIDFRLGSKAVPTFAALARNVEAAHGLLSINHPRLPSGEICMGCGWSVPDTDYTKVAAIEIVNGGATALFKNADNPVSGIPFWDEQLNKGHRITGIGGSDNHNGPSQTASVGYPTTVVYAGNLSDQAILEAIRAGHVFIDAEGTTDRTLEMTATTADAHAMMGDTLSPHAGEPVVFTLTTNVQGAVIKIIEDGKPAAVTLEPSTTNQQTFRLTADGHRHYVRAEVRDAQNKLLLIGNPIYLNY